MPRLPRRPLGDASYEVRRRGRRVRYFVEDVGYAARRVPVRAGWRVRDRWDRIPPQARRRVAIVVATVVAVGVIALALVPQLPCQVPGGESCAPADEAIGIVPENSLAYLHVNVDPGTDQYKQASELAKQIPQLAQQAILRLPPPGGQRVDYAHDVAPWLGGEGALAIIPGKGRQSHEAVLLEAGDEGKALKFSDRIVGRKPKKATVDGVDVRTGNGAAAALVGGFLVLGTKNSVTSVIATDQGKDPSLADSSTADEVRDALPDHRIAEVYVSRAGARALLAQGQFASFESFVNYRATEGAGAALVTSSDAAEIDVHSVLDAARAKKSPGFFGAFPPFEPDLTSSVSANAYAYLGAGDPEVTIRSLLLQAKARVPALVAGFQSLSAELRRLGKVNLEKQVLPLLGSEASVALEPVPQPKHKGKGEGGNKGKSQKNGGAQQKIPTTPTAPAPQAGAAAGQSTPGVIKPIAAPYVSFVADEVDEKHASDVLGRLEDPVAKALSPPVGGNKPGFSNEKIGGVDAHSLKLSPNVDLTYGLVDGKLVISTDPAGVNQVAKGSSHLDDSSLYQDATKGFPPAVSTLLYLNLGRLIKLAEQQGLAEDPAYALFASDIRKLRSLAVAVVRGPDAIDTQARLSVGTG